MSHRLMLFVPEINPDTFVFFYYEGTTGRSYSIRDYSSPAPARVRRADRYPYRAEEILALSQRPGSFRFPAEKHPTDDWKHWHGRTIALNAQYLSGAEMRAPARAAADPCLRATESNQSSPVRRSSNSGAAEKGSRYCLQQFVEHRGEELANWIICASPSLSAFDIQRFEWKSPLASEDYYEYRDDFLQPLGLEEHLPALQQFWPAGGPQWDGLALLSGHSKQGVLLLEAKAHPGETLSTCKASGHSLPRIEATLNEVREHMGASPTDWLNGSYQLANRLAYLYFINEVVRVPAWLALINFVDDPTHKPTSLADWRLHQQTLFRALGIHPGCRMLDRIITVLLKPTLRSGPY